jgi:hypothetical protein
LAPYKDDSTVAAAIDRAVTALSKLQNASGGFTSWGTVNAESIAQVITALTAVGIDPATDARFVKANGNTVEALLAFYVAGGGFSHTLGGAFNQMATEQAAYALVAYDRYVDGRNSLYDMSDAVTATPPPPPEGDGAITLAGPTQVSNAAGSSFNLSVLTDGWPDDTYRLIDGLINIPEQFTVTAVAASPRLTGGQLQWNLADDHKLRFVYTNTTLAAVDLTGDDWPALLATVTLEVVSPGVDPAVTPTADITVGGLTAKTDSTDQFVFDISKARHTVGFPTVGISVVELFTGDGVDLIPATTRAVAVSFSGVSTTGRAPAFKGQALISSPELTAKKGLPTYVLVTTPTITSAELIAVASYTFPTGTAQAVKFGDTDANGIINAQDALDEISAWLRLKTVSGDLAVLSHNVTSDARINTFDALAVMEHYVSGTDFAITLK